LSARGFIGRRHLLQACVGGTILVAAAPRAQPQAKLTKQQAEYEDKPRDIRMCSTCSFFEPPKDCKVVEGDVSPDGWCNLFALVD
jgi:hypothetical protein